MRNLFNRELSWLEFNVRVLEEAYDKSNPLLERLKFLSIVSSNMDEFFMVRVGSLRDQVLAGFKEPDSAGLTPKEQLEKISHRVHEIVEDQYYCYNQLLVSELEKETIFIRRSQFFNNEKEFMDNYYWKNIYPVLTPMVVDQSRPFPLILNRSLNIAILLQNPDDKNDERIFATVQVPSVLGRLIELPSENNQCHFILMEDLIKMYLKTLFRGHVILTKGCYRVTRNADLGLDEEGAEDLLEEIEVSLRKRKWSSAIRLEVEKDMDPELLNLLKEEMEVPDKGVYDINGPLDPDFFNEIKLSSRV